MDLCPAPSIILDTGTPLKCSRSLKFFLSGEAPEALPGLSGVGWWPGFEQKRRLRLTNQALAETIRKLHPLQHVGLWRSLGARFHGMEEVVGSIPTRSTKSFQ